ncbi:uncharacterized protein LOC111346576 [Stylophora pistillata]|uniref:uncharacterized protein LOC111346576 n=1 Tax=Stylophora pistillata TaxID=50429 RepID=UPI000C04A57C|nr:uncharacterized protein LOC111346576 [Stylophora pistillata]
MICSKYTFHTEKGKWSVAMNSCKKKGGSLVSMETESEWHFVKNLAGEQDEKTPRWFIGLQRVEEPQTWCWLSKKVACIAGTANGTAKGTWRWNEHEPNHPKTEKCVEMLNNGKYNNIQCQAENYDDNPGYICEKHFNCSIVSKNESIFVEEKTGPVSTNQSIAIKATASSPRTQLTDGHKMLSEGLTDESQASTTSRVRKLTTTASTTQTKFYSVVKKVGDLNCKNDNDYFTLYLTIAVLAGFLFVILVILFGVFRQQKKQQKKADARKGTVIQNQHDYGENLQLNALKVGAQLSLAAGSKRNQSEPSVQQEGVYTALCSETMMVITQTKRLELANMNTSQLLIEMPRTAVNTKMADEKLYSWSE